MPETSPAVANRGGRRPVSLLAAPLPAIARAEVLRRKTTRPCTRAASRGRRRSSWLPRRSAHGGPAARGALAAARVQPGCGDRANRRSGARRVVSGRWRRASQGDGPAKQTRLGPTPREHRRGVRGLSRRRRSADRGRRRRDHDRCNGECARRGAARRGRGVGARLVRRAYARSRRPLRHEIRNRAICRRIPRRRAMRCSGTP